MVINKLTRSIFTILIIVIMLSCGKKPVQSSPNKTSISQLASQILFSPMDHQMYQDPLAYFQSVDDKSLSGEKTVLKGLAHIYQGEVYEITAQMLSKMQIDLYYKSIDLEHGSKFPITQNFDGINSELRFWMGVDAYTAFDDKESSSLLSSSPVDPFYPLKQKIVDTYSVYSGHYTDQTFLSTGITVKDFKKPMFVLEKILEGEKLFKDNDYDGVLALLDNETLYNRDLFPHNNEVMYFSPAVFKLAALAHYKLGIQALESALQKNFITSDSTGYKIIAIMNLGEKYYYFQDSVKLSVLWNDYESFLVSNGPLVAILVEKNEKMPYCLDWIKFEEAIENGLGLPLPGGLKLLQNSSDISLNIMKQFIKNPFDTSHDLEISHVLLDFINNPDSKDNYPTLISGFIKELNRSQIAFSEKKNIQEVSESLVFNLKHSKASYQRNRPAFLLSLYGTLRWHGGRLPDCNGFLIDMKNSDKNMSPLLEIASLFTQRLI